MKVQSRARPSLLKLGLGMYLGATALLTVLNFPYHYDEQSAPALQAAAKADSTARPFYDKIYERVKNEAPAAPEPAAPGDSDYVEMAKVAVHELNVNDKIGDFVSRYGLKDKKVLDIGAGSGYLQDMVDDYTGLDITPEAKRFFHKKYVVGSATALPFPDASFDAVWTIWVLEHVPNPEKALAEMRRVVKPGGYIYLWPAWDVPAWSSSGAEATPYAQLDVAGKLLKASIPFRRTGILDGLYTGPVRLARLASARWLGPTHFRYHLLKPNFDRYLTTDSDAVNSMDPYEAYLWYVSRGDRCMNCRSMFKMVYEPPYALVFRVKAGEAPGASTVASVPQ